MYGPGVVSRYKVDVRGPELVTGDQSNSNPVMLDVGTPLPSAKLAQYWIICLETRRDASDHLPFPPPTQIMSFSQYLPCSIMHGRHNLWNRKGSSDP